MDYASTTPVSKRVFKAMKPFFRKDFANPSSIYMEGVKVKEVLFESKRKIAKILNTQKENIFFTGSGTESCNMAILGAHQFFKGKVENPHYITSEIEHPAVLEAFKYIEESGGNVSVLKVNEEGLINPQDVSDAITDQTVLVSLMLVNNEIGVIQPISKIARLLKKKRGEKKYPYFHTDASQALNYLDCNIDKLGVDMMTLDGSKIYGPKGVGCLVKKQGIEILPINYGGGQEGGLRSGTENIPNIVGFTEAMIETEELRESEVKRLSKLQKLFFDGIKDLENVSLNGSLSQRVVNNINICVKGINSEFEVIRLDEKGLSISFMTACKNMKDDSFSYVIKALSKEDCASSSLRFSFGRGTTKQDVLRAIELTKEIASPCL